MGATGHVCVRCAFHSAARTVSEGKREEREREIERARGRRGIEGRGESGVPPSVAKEDRRVRVVDKRRR